MPTAMEQSTAATSQTPANQSLAPGASNPLMKSLQGASYAEGQQLVGFGSGPMCVADDQMTGALTGDATRCDLARGLLLRLGVPATRLRTPEAVGEAALARGIFADASKLDLDQPVLRSQAAVMVSRAFAIPSLPAGEVRRCFKDLPVTHWAAPAVYGAVTLGLLHGYGDETFGPGNPFEAQYLDGFLDKAKGLAGATLPEAVPEDATFDPRVEWGARSTLGATTVDKKAYHESLDSEQYTTRSATGTEKERVDATNSIVDELDASNSARYDPKSDATYCNVFAHDFAFLMGAFVPRVWWNNATLEAAEKGEPFPEPVYGTNTHELNANALYHWFLDWGHRYGWASVGGTDAAGLTEGQRAANEGRVVVIVGDTNSGYSGHITAVVPETEEEAASRDEDGMVQQPVQSQAGADPTTRGTSGWFEHTNTYKGGLGVFVHG